MERQLFTITSDDRPLSIVSASDAIMAIEIAAKLIRIGRGDTIHAPLAARQASDLECRGFREKCFDVRGAVKLAAILVA